MRTLPYLEHFQATRRRVEDLSTEPNLCGVATDLPGYVYADRFWIEIEPTGGLYLPLPQGDTCKANPDDLPILEGLLFEYATQHEHCDAEECHIVCFARHMPCPKVCPVCGGAS